MKRILLFLLLKISLFAGGLDGIGAVSSVLNESSSNKSDMSIVEELETQIPTQEQAQVKETQIEQVSQDMKKVPKYFAEYISFASCEPASIKCPPLKTEYVNDYYTRLIGFDAYSGLLDCQVLRKNDNTYTVFASKSFTNTKCANDINSVRFTSQITNSSKEFNERLQKDVDFNVSLLQKANGQLDVADVMDSLVSFDAETFDFNASLNSQSIQLQNGLTFDNLSYTKKTKELIDVIREKSDAFFSLFNITQFNPMDKANYQVVVENKNDNYFDTSLLFFIEAFVYKYEVMSSILWWLFIIALGWGVLDITMNFHHIQQDKLYVVKRAGFALIVYLFFFASVTPEKVQIDGKNIDIEMTRAQGIIGEMYKATNQIADDLTGLLYKKFLKNLNTRDGIIDANALENQEKNMNQLYLQNKKMEVLNTSCYDTYDTQKIKSILETTRSSKKGINELLANPFPVNEDEILKWHKDAYNTGQFGILKNAEKPTITASGCYKIKEQILKNQVKIDSIQKNIDNFNDKEYLATKAQEMGVLNDFIYSNYNHFGYLSLIFLPTLDSLYNLNKIVDNKLEDYQNILMANDYKSVLSGAVKNSALLMFLPLATVQEFIMQLSHLFPSSWVPFGVGEVAANIVSAAATLIAVDFLSEALPHLKTIVFFLVGAYAFILVFVQKFITYFTAPFITIYALATQKEEKILSVIANIIYVSIKTLLVISAIIITMFALFLIQTLSEDFTNSFVELCEAMGILQGVIGWFISGTLFIFQLGLEVVVIVALLHHIPKAFASQIKVAVEDLADSVNNVIQHKFK